MNALAYALQLLSALPQLIAAGVEVTALIKKAEASLQAMSDETRGPTPIEWQELDDEISRLRGELHDGDTTGTA